jgi:uncharacterized protein involved in response to NO
VARSLSLHGAIPDPVSRPRLALAAKGFRPFFLLAAAFAVAIVPLWLAVLTGLASASAYPDPVTWHAHEMIFGYTAAVVGGFLLTAVGNWTQRETLVGGPLLALAGLWLLGRVAVFFAASLPRGVPALVDLAFLPLVVVALARPIVLGKNRRNAVMLVILSALFAANVVVHLDALGMVSAGSARRACVVALDVILVIVLIIAGRVFPMFTRNATGVQAIRSIPALDIATVIGMVTVAVLDATVTDARLVGSVAGVVGVLAALRAMHWGARHTLREPLLWILHLGYAWLVVGLLLRAAAGWLAVVPSSSAAHALTVGAIGSLTLGMMARVALGHTGRPLVVSRALRWAFLAISGAAAVRVIVPIALPGVYVSGLVLAGALWTGAFLTFLAVYAPILCRPRADGKPG